MPIVESIGQQKVPEPQTNPTLTRSLWYPKKTILLSYKALPVSSSIPYTCNTSTSSAIFFSQI